MASKGFIELLRLADLAKARETGRYDTEKTNWSGIVFEVAGMRFVAPMGEVNEVLSLPRYTNIPLVKPWLLGVANVRGRLLPITNLPIFLGVESQQPRLSQRKVMVIDQESCYAGLLVDKVLGIQSFTDEQYRAEALPLESPFAKFNHGKFVKDEQDWFVFRPSLLAQDEHFSDATLN